MSSYNLDNEPEHFTFVLKGNEYKMAYPNTEQINELAKLENDKDMSEEDKVKKQTEYFTDFIAPVKPESPPITEAMESVSIKQIQAFNKMLKTELSLE